MKEGGHKGKPTFKANAFNVEHYVYERVGCEYGLRPFRHRRMHRQTIIIKGPKSFIEQVLWPEFQELNAALIAYRSEITEKVIREEVHKETGEAEEVDESARIGR